MSENLRIARIADKLRTVRAIQHTLFEILRHVPGAMSAGLEAQLKAQFAELERWDEYEHKAGDPDDDDD